MSIIVYILFSPSLIVFIAAETSSITLSQSLSYGKTLVSPSGIFELGFCNLGNPNKIYLGIWYKNIPLQNIVWVANGGNPIKDSFSILKLDSSGNLVLTHNNTVVWSTSSPEKAQNPVAELLDSGNLVIRDENEDKEDTYLWQSFDYPSNTMLSGMKVGWDIKRNLSTCLIAWKSDNDPTQGDLSWGITLHPYPDIYMMKGTKKYHRFGPWNGLRFSGMPLMKPNNPIYHYEFVSNQEVVYYRWSVKQTSSISKVVLNQTTLELPENGQSLYIRLPASEIDKPKKNENIERQLEDLDVPLFHLLTITTATNNFSLNNKIGQGGFGPVYKGKLVDGREIAVKRLSSSSGQGITEFITEVKLIAKLQHRNLVRLLGCCFRGQEKLLVYEYMVNGSLDTFIFGHHNESGNPESNIMLDVEITKSAIR
ncbi:hypothetical protein GLYMA_U042800v4 [Glycine max]|nr:hypothetical protein GLYMA_U042800v4 [Glycine max]